MNAISRIALSAIVALTVTTLPLASIAAPHARYSDAPSYTGQPTLPVTLSMVIAGGGPGEFQTVKLVGLLAGSKTKAEVAKLTNEYGQKNVTSFLDVFNYVISDALSIVRAKRISLHAAPKPAPTDGKALAAALYRLGEYGNGNFDVEYMLDGLVSHGIHVQVMDDIDKKFGRPADANYHKVLQTAMTDLKSVYGF